MPSDPEHLVWDLCAELRQRLLAGEECNASTFLDANPTLASDPECAVHLIYMEFRTRQELGQQPDPQDWLRRFPRWEQALRRQFSVLGWAAQANDVKAFEPTVDHGKDSVRDDLPPLHPHELRGLLGEGGMGIVYVAWDSLLGREVALKTLQATPPGSSHARRFLREARVMAGLIHPHIVPVYDIGVFEGEPAFTMRLITGGNLARRVEEVRRDPRTAVRLMEKVARAVHAAHERGVIHRDLKPSNILLDEHGEPFVADFGLARPAEPGEEMTRTGMILGTPAYMSPEQAAGRGHEVTPASDVWSLGVILYELLVGRRPFLGDLAGKSPEQARKADFPRPRRANPRLHRDLEAVILGCLEVEPARRYPSAGALADDLARWLRGEPVRSEANRWHRRWARLWQRRLRQPALVALALLVALLPGLAWLVHYLAPVPPPSPSPGEKWLAQAERDLRAGKKVTLVGEKGIPKYYRWWAEKDRGPLVPRAHIPLYVEAHERSYLELLPRVPIDAYRFSGEVQIRQTRNGEAGLYVAGEKVVIGKSEEYRTVNAVFSDQHTPDPRLFFGLWLYRPWPAPDEGPRRVTFFKDHKLKGLKTKGEWHPLAFEVAPEGFWLFWEGASVFHMGRGPFDHFVGALGIGPQPLNRAFGPRPKFSPQGPLGLLVYDADVHFRNVTIEPLRNR